MKHTAPLPVFLAALFLVGVSLYFVALAADAHWLKLLSKPLPLLALIIWTTRSAPGTVGRLTAVGLVLGLIGDVLLSLGDGTFLLGLVSFLLGHIAYTAAFSLAARQLAPLLLIPMLVYVAAVSPVLVPVLGGLAGPVVAYMVFIGVMAWRAAAFAQARGGFAAAALLGAILFMFSDTIIAVNRFVSPISGADVAIMLTYWAGQAALAAGVVLSAPAAGEGAPEPHGA
jgi:uncharacterized membrane protein YhhN